MSLGTHFPTVNCLPPTHCLKMETPAARVKPVAGSHRATPAAAPQLQTTSAVPSTMARATREANFQKARAAVTAARTHARGGDGMPMPEPRDEIAMSTLPRRTQRPSGGTPQSSRRSDGRPSADAAAILFPVSSPSTASRQQPQTGARRPREDDEVFIASPAARGPRPESARAAALDFARSALEDPLAPAAAGATPADLWAVLAPEEEPMTATQEAIPAADGYQPASPPPLFSLRSVSMDRGDASPLAADDAATATTTRAVASMDDATRADLWASSAKAYFDLIDSKPLRVAKPKGAASKTAAPDAGPLTRLVGL